MSLDLIATQLQALGTTGHGPLPGAVVMDKETILEWAREIRDTHAELERLRNGLDRREMDLIVASLGDECSRLHLAGKRQESDRLWEIRKKLQRR